jgi:hypothetical protein
MPKERKQHPEQRSWKSFATWRGIAAWRRKRENVGIRSPLFLTKEKEKT